MFGYGSTFWIILIVLISVFVGRYSFGLVKVFLNVSDAGDEALEDKTAELLERYRAGKQDADDPD